LHASFDLKKNPLNPRGYTVPDFGVDRDIVRTEGSIAQSEKVLGKKMNATFSQKDNALNPRNYFVPDFGVDQGILAT
jgi:hypothetical protein